MHTQNPDMRPGFQLESYLSQGGMPVQRGLRWQRVSVKDALKAFSYGRQVLSYVGKVNTDA